MLSVLQQHLHPHWLLVVAHTADIGAQFSSGIAHAFVATEAGLRTEVLELILVTHRGKEALLPAADVLLAAGARLQTLLKGVKAAGAAELPHIETESHAVLAKSYGAHLLLAGLAGGANGALIAAQAHLIAEVHGLPHELLLVRIDIRLAVGAAPSEAFDPVQARRLCLLHRPGHHAAVGPFGGRVLWWLQRCGANVAHSNRVSLQLVFLWLLSVEQIEAIVIANVEAVLVLFNEIFAPRLILALQAILRVGWSSFLLGISALAIGASLRFGGAFFSNHFLDQELLAAYKVLAGLIF